MLTVTLAIIEMVPVPLGEPSRTAIHQALQWNHGSGSEHAPVKQQLDTSSFGRFFQPLEERRKQLEIDIPRLQAQIDITTVQAISAEEVASEAQNLTKLWPKMDLDERRRIVEAITERLDVGKSEIDITFCYSPAYTFVKKVAEGRGFEPPVGLRLRLISSQVPLTTQPPFHKEKLEIYLAWNGSPGKWIHSGYPGRAHLTS
jgi:hypothetical protein